MKSFQKYPSFQNLHEHCVKHNCLFDSVTTKQIAPLIFSSVIADLFMDPKFKFIFNLYYTPLLITRERKIEKFHEYLGKKSIRKRNRKEVFKKNRFQRGGRDDKIGAIRQKRPDFVGSRGKGNRLRSRLINIRAIKVLPRRLARR